MKTGSLLAVVGSVICFVVPAFSQQKNTADSKIVQQRDLLGVPKAIDDFGALSLKLEEAFKKNDASAIAALFTEDGILVASDGMFSGRQAIEKRYTDIFQLWPLITFSSQRYQLNAIDNAVWSVGEWWSTIQTEAGPKFDGGYWSAIYTHEGEDWKIRLLTVSGRPQPSRD
jgi:ketosteroid isomerase-like protein